MYRANIGMEENNKNAQGDVETSIISRVSNLPIVHSAVDQVQNVYSKAKESHPYVKSTLEVAEKTVTVAAESAKPYVNKLEGPISTANTYANKGLDKLEEKVPVITKPADEVYEATVKPGVDYVKNVAGYSKETVNAGIQKIHDTKDAGLQKVTDAKDYTMQHVDAALKTSYGQVLIKGVDTVLAKTEEYVDYYLPPNEASATGERNGSSSESACGGGEEGRVEHEHMKRVSELSSKVRRRMYVHALRQMHHLQLRSSQTLQSLHFTVDLIEYAKSNIDNANQKVKDSFHLAQQKVVETWTQINTDNNADGDPPKQLSEHQALVVARNLTNMLSTAYNSAYAASYSLLPATLQQSLERGRQNVDELYKAFNQATHFEDISVSAVHESRERLSSVQTELQRVAGAVINSKVLSWLVPEYDVTEINLEGEVFGDSDNTSLNLSIDQELRAMEMREQEGENQRANNNMNGGDPEPEANVPAAAEQEEHDEPTTEL